MREIKFRGWDKKDKKIVEILSIGFDNGENNYICVRDGKSLNFVDANRIVLMQYTGLKDKNGVDVYEGYICKIHVWFGGSYTYCNLPIIFKDGKFCYEIYCGSGDYEMMDLYDDLTVMGNIYENPDLLEKEE